ncbi:MAG: hypothetical protein AAF903_15845 [Pseudomonadota bacterium]
MAVRAETDTTTERALEQLVQYFPVETMTLFLSVVSFKGMFEQGTWIKDLSPFALIGAFALITPLMVLLVAFATFREEKQRGTIQADKPFTVPVFDMLASAIAFSIWALAVPGQFESSASGEEGSANMFTAEMAQCFAAIFGFFASWVLSQIRIILGLQSNHSYSFGMTSVVTNDIERKSGPKRMPHFTTTRVFRLPSCATNVPALTLADRIDGNRSSAITDYQ